MARATPRAGTPTASVRRTPDRDDSARVAALVGLNDADVTANAAAMDVITQIAFLTSAYIGVLIAFTPDIKAFPIAAFAFVSAPVTVAASYHVVMYAGVARRYRSGRILEAHLHDVAGLTEAERNVVGWRANGTVGEFRTIKDEPGNRLVKGARLLIMLAPMIGFYLVCLAMNVINVAMSADLMYHRAPWLVWVSGATYLAIWSGIVFAGWLYIFRKPAPLT